MTDRVGRRQQHKQRTRQAINAAAKQLFFAAGFDSVTVADVATRAGVSVATVFNYFDTKEDLFFDEVEPLAAALAATVRSCPPGASVLAALRAHLGYQLTGGRAEIDFAEVAQFHDAIGHSVALQRREQEIQLYRRQVLARALADTLGEEHPSAASQLAAAQYLAVEHIVASRLRCLLRTGQQTAAALRELMPVADQLFAAVRDGLGPMPRARSRAAAATAGGA
ncbi:MAG: TetR/AcrR family transcriptional regulator [Jatrophihabitantaceae bacterium]